MLNNKRTGIFIAVTLVLSVLVFYDSAMAWGDDPDILDKNTGESAEYDTTTVEYGDMVSSAQASAYVEYPYSQNVQCEVKSDSTQFVEYLVENWTYVTKGTPLVSIKTDVDEITLKDLNERLYLAQEAYDCLKAEYDGEFKAAQLRIDNAEGSGAREKYELMYDKLKSEADYALSQKMDEVDGLMGEICDANEAVTATSINASADGVVYFADRYLNGDIINYGDSIAAIYITDKIMLSAKDTSGIFEYGMKVTVTSGVTDSSMKPVTLHGEVVSADSTFLSDSLKSDTAYIKIDEDTAGLSFSRKVTITYDTFSLNNVLLIASDAVNSDSAGSYVYVLGSGGGLTKQYFLPGHTGNNMCYIVDGLTQGTVAVIR